MTDTNVDTFKAVLATVTAGEFDKLAAYMTDDLVFDLPYGPDFLPMPIVGLEPWNQMQLMTFQMFSSFALELVEVHECVDPDKVIFEYRSNAVVARNDNEYVNTYIGVVKIRDGKIAAWKEFHNPEATKVL
jgi:ketosteroid isomerase-like protein